MRLGRLDVGASAVGPHRSLPPKHETKTAAQVGDRFVGIFDRVGATGFEPATFCSRSKRATRLRYAPVGPTCFQAGAAYCQRWIGLSTHCRLEDDRRVGCPRNRQTQPHRSPRPRLVTMLLMGELASQIRRELLVRYEALSKPYLFDPCFARPEAGHQPHPTRNAPPIGNTTGSTPNASISATNPSKSTPGNCRTGSSNPSKSQSQ